jgi:uncharacterized membrane protein YfcA
MFWPFSALGLFAALVANSTGSGGGVVFVPAFSALRENGYMKISPERVVGISFAIQSFGMSVGSLTWINRLYQPDGSCNTALLWRIIGLVLATGLPALLVMQYVVVLDSHLAFVLFKIFSIVQGATLLAQVAFSRHGAERKALAKFDVCAIVTIGIAGGCATALFSVGIGELLAVFLFIRRFPLDICVATAVISSAVSVIAGAVLHVWAQHIIWEILIFAAPAVCLGGFLARGLVHRLGPVKLKLGTAAWVIASSAYLLSRSETPNPER